MGWNGSGTVNRTDGTRSGASVWTDALAADEDVNAQDHDTHDEDLADAIENCVAKDGQNTPTANLPMGGYKHTGAGSGTANGQYVIFDQFAYTSYTPTLSVGGGSTYTSTTTTYAKYRQINKDVKVKANFTGTLGGSATDRIFVTLPVTTNGDSLAGSAHVVDNGTRVGAFIHSVSTTQIEIQRYDSANFTAGTISIVFNFDYEAA